MLAVKVIVTVVFSLAALVGIAVCLTGLLTDDDVKSDSTARRSLTGGIVFLAITYSIAIAAVWI